MLLFLIACATKTEQVPEAPPTPPAAEAPTAPVEAARPEPPPAPALAQTVALHMSEQFSRTVIARDRFIHGEVDGARETLAWIAEAELPGALPQGAEPHLTTLREAAKVGAAATQLDETAGAIAQLGAACGSCHSALGAGPAVELGPAPPESTELLPHMLRHQWAVNGMWLGLVGPSDEAWAQGAAAMAEAPLPQAAYDLADVSSGAWDNAVTAHKAAGGVEGGDRADAYAAVIASCAGCHAEMVGE